MFSRRNVLAGCCLGLVATPLLLTSFIFLNYVDDIENEPSFPQAHPHRIGKPIFQPEEKLEGLDMEMENTRNLHIGASDDKQFYEQGKPKLLELVRKIDDHLRSMDTPCYNWEGPFQGYIPGCSRKCASFLTLHEAQRQCHLEGAKCGGVTLSGNHYELRSQDSTQASQDGESSYLKMKCTGEKTTKKLSHAEKIFHNFQAVVDKSLSDPRYQLDYHPEPDANDLNDDDATIFISVASYRDPSCGTTIHEAFTKADHPERIQVGIVEQNCHHNCRTGTGWGKTRRIVDAPPDVDCLEGRCSGDTQNRLPGFPPELCDNIRILKLNESESFGPFFARYLVSKMWRGETFFLQIDSHSHFHKGWDSSLIEQLKLTPSYPHSVISNYPPPFSDKSADRWNSGTPTGLCRAHFSGDDVLRLEATGREYHNEIQDGHSVPEPKHTLYVAAGFFFARSEFLYDVPYDPFLPFLFMGEEIIMSARLWTAGWDIFGPSVDVLKHEYERRESPKFWESVNSLFHDGAVHNELSELVLKRIKALLRYKGYEEMERIEPNTLLTRIGDYALGSQRSLDDYFEIASIDVQNMRASVPTWCKEGSLPPYYIERL